LRETIGNSIYSTYRFVGTGSATYRAYLDQLAKSLTSEWDVRDKRVLEIGCSDGYLLKQLREKGSNQVFGYEPSSQLQQVCLGNGIPVSGAFFSPDSVTHCPILPVDIVIIRHVLEHIDDLHVFLNAVSSVLTETGLLIIEVPDVEAVFARGLYFHFYHEHLSYFSLATLQKLLSHHGFRIIWHRTVKIHGGSLYVICKRYHGIDSSHPLGSKAANDLERVCTAFATHMQSYLDAAHRFVNEQCASGICLAGYGAAHRTTIACSLAKVTPEHIRYLVDKNSYLHGFYIPGAHLPIYSPDKIHQDLPDAIIIFATSFEEEIIREQQAFREAGGRFITLFPEVRYLS